MLHDTTAFLQLSGFPGIKPWPRALPAVPLSCWLQAIPDSFQLALQRPGVPPQEPAHTQVNSIEAYRRWALALSSHGTESAARPGGVPHTWLLHHRPPHCLPSCLLHSTQHFPPNLVPCKHPCLPRPCQLFIPSEEAEGTQTPLNARQAQEGVCRGCCT